MDGTTDDRYFEWLYSQVGAVRNRNPKRSYWDLCRQLHKKEFVWLIPNDDNRVEEGKELRYEFVDVTGIDEPTSDWYALGCSMLEMMIALARRASFETDAEPAHWFWTMIDHAGLRRFNDIDYHRSGIADYIDEVLDCIIYRNYNYDGSGGLFPLNNVDKDQRNVELWYQLSAYILERSPV